MNLGLVTKELSLRDIRPEYEHRLGTRLLLSDITSLIGHYHESYLLTQAKMDYMYE